MRWLATSAVTDVVPRTLIPVGPEIDDEVSWRAYRRQQPTRRYAVGKRMLSTAELRCHGLQNLPPEEEDQRHNVKQSADGVAKASEKRYM